jgi:DNA-binding NarL/FixJ family response regulator
MAIRILLVDDHQLMRKGLRSMLAEVADIEVIGEAADGRAALQMVGDTAPDLVVMDISMPDLNGIDATRQILEKAPRTRVLTLSMHSDKQLVGLVLEAGASGFVLKDAEPGQLVEAIRTVAGGRVYLSPTVADLVLDKYVRHRPGDRPGSVSKLTPREREVLQLISEGVHTKTIASKLHVSPKTVETHRRNIMKKLGVDNVAELTKHAIRAGLTSLDV